MGFLDSLFFRSKTEEPPRQPRPPESVPPPEADDPLTVLQHSLEAVRESIRIEDRRLSELPTEDQEALEAIEQKRAFVRDQQLDMALCWLLREIWHYPAWSKRADVTLTLPLTQVSGEGGPAGKTIRFVMEGLSYQLIFKRWDSIGPMESDVEYADLSLLGDDGTLFLVLQVKQKVEDEYNIWRPSSTQGFKVGEWAVALTNMYTTSEAARSREMMGYLSGASRVDELRGTFDLSQKPQS